LSAKVRLSRILPIEDLRTKWPVKGNWRNIQVTGSTKTGVCFFVDSIFAEIHAFKQYLAALNE
jgi:hypothetical protein